MPDYPHPSQLAARVKWFHRETIDSFAHRLLRAAVIEPSAVDAYLRHQLKAHPEEGARTHLYESLIEGYGGREQGQAAALRTRAQPVRGAPYPARFACKLCTQGESIPQYSHDLENVCFRHRGQMVWHGPGTSAETQIVAPFDPVVRQAELAYRRHSRSGRFNPELTLGTWMAVRDDYSLWGGTHATPRLDKFMRPSNSSWEREGRLALLPETVAVAESLTDARNLSRWLNPGAPPLELRRSIREVLDRRHGLKHHDVLVERMVLILQPLRARAAHWNSSETWRTPSWPWEPTLDHIDSSAWTEAVTTGQQTALARVTSQGADWIAADMDELLQEWDWEKNVEVPTWTTLTGGVAGALSKRFHFRCRLAHGWTATIAARNRSGSGCPTCTGKVVLIGFNDLASQRPDLAAEWNEAPGANSLGPTEVTVASGKYVSWRCSQEHTWETTVANRSTRGSGCPVCAGQRVVQGLNDLQTLYPELALEWNTALGANDCRPGDIAAGSSRKVSWQCPRHHEYRASVVSRTSRGRGCPVCAGRSVRMGENDLATTHPGIASEWDTPATTRAATEVTAGSSYRASWRCSLGHKWQATVSNRAIGGKGCPVCAGRTLRRGFNDLASKHPHIAAQWDEMGNSCSPSEVTSGSGRRVRWVCSLGHHWVASIASRTRGAGCPICAGQVVQAGYNDLVTTDPALATEWNYAPGANSKSPTEVTRGSGYRTSWRCENGHTWSTTVNNRTRKPGSGCRRCKTNP